MFQTKVVEKIKTHILCLVTVLRGRDYKHYCSNIVKLQIQLNIRKLKISLRLNTI